ncbi:MAG TPA: hypothetical protein PKA98_16620 [Acidimicrobiales bacterium]|nr:hypothetical protein [Acidimicrobiales bacterium]
MRPSGRLALAFTLVAALLHVGTAGAISGRTGPEGSLLVTAFASGNPDQAVWDYEIDDVPCIDGTIVTVAGVDATVSQSDDNAGTISFPVGTPGGSYSTTFDCDTGKGVLTGTLALTFAAVTVTKVVEGDAPADATFPVTVACNTAAGGRVSTEFAEGASGVLLDTAITFPAAGGTTYLVAYTPQSCSIAELDDAGAVSATIALADCGDGGTSNAAPAGEAAGPDGGFVIFEPTDCTQTITNVFADAAQPADVVQPQPAFTG